MVEHLDIKIMARVIMILKKGQNMDIWGVQNIDIWGFCWFLPHAHALIMEM